MITHVRVNRGLLAAAEKRLLVRIAAALPRWVTSDQLTLLALGAMALCGAGFALARWEPRALWLVIVGLAVNWFGDSLDGTLARVRKLERPRYGYYIDHALDIAGTALLMSGLAVSGYMSPLVAIATLAAYLMVAGEVYLATAAGRDFTMSVAGVGPTELRLLLAIGALALFRDPYLTIGDIGRFRVFDVGGALATLGLLAAFVTAVVRNGRGLAAAEGRHRSCGRTKRGLEEVGLG
ncbi:MAG: CDP-alcohol phosphatidyltransferase family protein [Vicinamibacterales bacterium]